MSISLAIANDSPLDPSVGELWITGHGIPGSGPATNLMALGPAGTFAQIATQISSACSSGTTATITTAVAHGLRQGDQVFVAGVSPTGYDGLFVISSAATSTFQYDTTSQDLPVGTGGTVYGPGAITPPVTILSATSVAFGTGSGIAQITTSPAHGLQIGQTISVSTVATAGYDGTYSVTQVPSPTEFQFAYESVAALDPDTGGGQVQAVGLQPVLVSTLPSNGDGYQITLDSNIGGYSAKFIVYVAATSQPPSSLSFNGNLVTPTDPATPPFSPSTTPVSSVFDIVEFAYIPGANSTFDVSAVDGLALPMTLTAGSVTSGPSSVGVRNAGGYDRAAIRRAFGEFMTIDPLGAGFDKLRYAGAVTLAGVAIESALWSNNAASFTTTQSHGLSPDEWVTITGVTQGGYDGSFQVESTPTSTSFTVTNTDSSLTLSSGGTVTPLVFRAPPSIDGEFYVIAAPKDWLGNQSASMAARDPLATFWDATIDDFFANGNCLSIYLGKDPNYPTYSGSSDGTKYTLTNGASPAIPFTFSKPSGGSLDNALYVWAQANAPGGDQGLIQDQIWQALCRGVAQQGVSTTPISSNESTIAWTDSTAWYQGGVYCPYSKFLHYGTLSGAVDTSGATSIFLEAAAYGFGEDENPIGNPYRGPLVPSKLDGTVPDNTTVTLRVAPWMSPSN